jgi:hypothetical protein
VEGKFGNEIVCVDIIELVSGIELDGLSLSMLCANQSKKCLCELLAPVAGSSFAGSGESVGNGL